jgi:hypothetical protein
MSAIVHRLILAAAINAFNHHHIEYPLYIININTCCYSTVDFIDALSTIDKAVSSLFLTQQDIFFFNDDLFYYQHMYDVKACKK